MGGAISFAYYFDMDPTRTTTAAIDDHVDKPTGSTSLYIIFLSLMILSAILTQFLLPPSYVMMQAITERISVTREQKYNVKQKENDRQKIQHHGVSEETALLQDLPVPSHDLQDTTASANITTDNNTAIANDKESWMDEAKAALLLFTTNRSMQLLSLVFFYTGFNQPYQQATFTRFFSQRAIGMELIFFHAMEIVGAIFCGRLLDHQSLAATTTRMASPNPQCTTALQCLTIFLVINSMGNLLAFVQEQEAAVAYGVDGIPPIIDIASRWYTFLRPSCAFLCWGFADAQIQVYCYWLMGRLFRSSEDSSGKFSRAVAFYKCLQSLGYTLGFYLIPATRLSAMHQLVVSSSVFLLGTGLTFVQLPAP